MVGSVVSNGVRLGCHSECLGTEQTCERRAFQNPSVGFARKREGKVGSRVGFEVRLEVG